MLLIVVAISMALTLLAQGIKGVPLWSRNAPAVSQNSDSKGKNSVTEEETSVRIMAMVICSIMTYLYFSKKGRWHLRFS